MVFLINEENKRLLTFDKLTTFWKALCPIFRCHKCVSYQNFTELLQNYEVLLYEY